MFSTVRLIELKTSDILGKKRLLIYHLFLVQKNPRLVGKMHVCITNELHITTIVPETYPSSQHAKCQKTSKNLHQECCQAIYPHHFIVYFDGGRTSSVVGSMFWEKFVGLRSSLVEVRGHTGIAIKICSFYFLENGMFISQNELQEAGVILHIHTSILELVTIQ